MEDNEHDPVSGGGDAGLPDCAACGRPEKKHRASDNLCPPPSGNLQDVAYWAKGPGTFYQPQKEVK